MIEDEAPMIASLIDPNVAKFDPATILTAINLLIPMLLNLPCFKAQEMTPKAFAESVYNEKTGEFSSDAYMRCRRKSHRALVRSGHRNPTKAQVNELTRATLLHAMESEESVGVACAAEAATIPDDDEV